MPSPDEDGTYTDGGRLPRGPGAALVTSTMSAPNSMISAKPRFGAFILTRAGRCG